MIKTLVRLKYIHVRETGQPAPDSICYDTIAEYQDLLHREKVQNGTAIEPVNVGTTEAAGGAADQMQVDAD